MTSDVLEGTTPPPLTAQGQASSPAPVQRPILRAPVESFSNGQRVLGFALAIPAVALGIALGVADVAAPDTDMSLRTPALLAALLLVGQGVLDMIRFAGDSKKAKAAVSPVVPIALLLLAIWLGLSLLREAAQAPGQLVSLSLISAFVLFTLGWSLLRDKT